MTLRFDNDCVNNRVLSMKFMYTKEKYYKREINILKELSVTGRLCKVAFNRWVHVQDICIIIVLVGSK